VQHGDQYGEEQIEDASCSVEPELGASTREVYLGYGSWARAQAVIQSARRAPSGRAGRHRSEAPWAVPRPG
jgi:hypothetical protein